MIYTCTLNPSIDYVVELDQLQVGSLNRTKQSFYYPGGKGINVSRVLSNIGIENTALGYVGGFTGRFIKDFLSNEGIPHQFIEVEEPTRINVKLKTNRETEVNGAGPYISVVKQKSLLNYLHSLTKEDYLVLAGSLPSSISVDFYTSIAQLCSKKDIPFIIDVSGPALQEVLSFKPLLVKPNQHELGDLLGVTIETKAEAALYGKRLVEQGAQNVIVSMGGAGAVFINQDITAFANVPIGIVRNSVGAGDSTVAGFLAAYVKTADVLQAFQFGVAAGSATAFSSDLCKKEQVENILPQVKVERVG
ncbi:1-phosphofructokinase [Bacillus salitolerans]|uniref:1-phosphofructokinase n=1 Tax=Bacillus salitolerans TaxID=1437434 RepID=A0ABW4LUE7_9BACI